MTFANANGDASNLKAPTKVVIVGAGIFGVSTALHLLDRERSTTSDGPRYEITIVDRATSLPAVDAASTDLNKVIRESYRDEYYAKLAHQAIEEWRKRELWGDNYHESGFLYVDEAYDRATGYSAESYANDKAMGSRLVDFPSPARDTNNVRETIFPPPIELGSYMNFGYCNLDSGWADATGAVKYGLQRLEKSGRVTIRTGATVTDLTYGRDGQVGGVKLASAKAGGNTAEDEIAADVVILATGAWTPHHFAHLNLGLEQSLLANGQSVATIRLDPHEKAQYDKVPVIFHLSTGFYLFPPKDDGTIKFAIHHEGYLNPKQCERDTSKSVSTPRTILSDPVNGMKIPEAMETELRAGLRGVYPALADRPFSSTRMCWYCDAPGTDWLIDWVVGGPASPATGNGKPNGVLVATGGSGHAFKFLPVIGRLVVDRLEGTLSAMEVEKFGIKRAGQRLDGDGSRSRSLYKTLDTTLAV